MTIPDLAERLSSLALECSGAICCGEKIAGVWSLEQLLQSSRGTTLKQYLRAALVCSAILAAVGCSKSNPLIGKWKAADSAGPECLAFAKIEFTPQTMTMTTPLAPVTSNVTYTHDGDKWSVSLANGQSISFESESGGLKSLMPECHLVPDK